MEHCYTITFFLGFGFTHRFAERTHHGRWCISAPLLNKGVIQFLGLGYVLQQFSACSVCKTLSKYVFSSSFDMDIIDGLILSKTIKHFSTKILKYQNTKVLKWVSRYSSHPPPTHANKTKANAVNCTRLCFIIFTL